MGKTVKENIAGSTPAIEWEERTCKTCRQKFWLRKINDKSQVYRQNCSRCRQKMGHPTAVDWRKT